MSLPERTEFLIVGAGPTGLACALSLNLHGCTDITVVDAVEHGEDSSRAIAVHAATLEALYTVGCADTLIGAGQKETSFTLWDGSRFHTVADFSTIASYTKYPFVLIISQYVTERILGEKAREKGVKVVRSKKVVGLRINEQDTNMTDVLFEGGEVVQARYVVGADGAKSTVRQAAGIKFADPDHQALPNGTDSPNEKFTQAILADVTFAEPLPAELEKMLFILSTEGAFLFIPLPPSSYDEPGKVYRIGGGIPPSMGVPPRSPPTPYLQQFLDMFGPGTVKFPLGSPKLTISKNLWSTRFRTHSSIADTFFTRLGWAQGGQYYSGGVILLIGDAAHIHSPAGGQGMNLGIRDAISLGATLALHHSTTEPVVSPSEYRHLDRPLREWADLRHQHGLTVIGLTKRLLGFATLSPTATWYLGIIPINWSMLRNLALNVATRFTATRRAAAWRLSGLGNR